jgi:hypothetical protein
LGFDSARARGCEVLVGIAYRPIAMPKQKVTIAMLNQTRFKRFIGRRLSIFCLARSKKKARRRIYAAALPN